MVNFIAEASPPDPDRRGSDRVYGMGRAAAARFTTRLYRVAGAAANSRPGIRWAARLGSPDSTEERRGAYGYVRSPSRSATSRLAISA